MMRDVGRGLQSFWNDPSGRAILGVALTMIGTATVFYRLVEDLDWIDSLYFSVVTISTVGYGDISPETVPGKLFTMAYVVVGIGVFVATVSTIGHHQLAVKQPTELETPGD